MSSCFVSLHPHQVRLQYLHRKHPSSCNGGPSLSIIYLQMTFGHPYCTTSPAGIVYRRFFIFAVTSFPRLAQSPYLIFLTCFQLRLAIPIPKILDRTKQASFPSALVLDSIQVWCQQHATTKSLFPAAYHIVSLFRMPVWFTNFWCSSKNFVVISARHSLRSVEVKFSGVNSFPIKRSAVSEYIGLSSILSLALFIIRGFGESIYPTKL
jgi:hypothetical protein